MEGERGLTEHRERERDRERFVMYCTLLTLGWAELVQSGTF